MSHSHRHRPRAARGRPSATGGRLGGAAALVLLALLVAPWLAGHLSRSPRAPALAAFLTLSPALYYWFRGVQQATARTAVVLSVAYAALAAGVLWLWSAH